MSQMACHCGGIIRDHQIPCPTEGWILRDQEQETFVDQASEDIADFYEAVRAGQRDTWITAYFSPRYPTDVSDGGIVSDILSVHKKRVFLSVAECENCGRLWVQRESDVNSYRSYAPDEPGYAGVLRSRVL
jgi:hypothetical protein